MGGAPAGPLRGLRVLDFGHYVAGPLAAVLLADQGAEVIQVVRPGAAHWNPPAQDILGRGKRRLEIDVQSPQGAAEARKLASQADVLIENFRPGVMDRLGLGFDDLSADNAGLIYVSLPAYSRHDSRAECAGWDSTLAAASGLFTDSSLGGAAFDFPPTYTELPLPSMYAGMWGAIGAVAAVYGRQRHGHGARLEVPLLDAAMSSAAGVIYSLKNHPARYNALPISRNLIDAISLNKVPESIAQVGDRVIRNAMPPFVRNYRCSDGELLLICAIDNTNQVDTLLAITGLTDELDGLGLHRGEVFDLPATKNNVYAYRGRSRAWIRLQKRLATVFASDTAQAWADRLGAAGVPATRQCLTSEFVDHPAVVTSGIIVRTDTGVAPGPYVDVLGSCDGTDVRTRTSPAGDQTTTEAPRGWTTERAFAPPAATCPPPNPWSPLSDVKVLDLTNVIAGPAAGRTLADLGAAVLHVSDTVPAMGPRQTVVYGVEVHQGKRDLALDLHSTSGKDVLGRLLPHQDVVLYNKVTAQATRLGVAPEQIHSLNEGAVVTQVTAFSGPDGGGWEDRPGFDPILQAFSGVMRRYGGPDGPHIHGIASCIDYLTGFSGAFSTVVGLLARQNGATRLFTRTSLARTAAWIQLCLLNEPGSDLASEGLRAKGPHPLNRMYRATDGWVHVCASNTAWSRARKRLGNDAPVRPDEAGRWLTDQVRARTSLAATAWARRAGLAAEPVRTARSLRSEATPAPASGVPVAAASASGRICVFTHPDNETYILPMPLWLRAQHDRPQLSPAPRPGQHTRETLLDLGYHEDQVETMLRDGAASVSWFTSDRYVPE
ncbi:hypothetical protein BOO86_08950 [Mycobacterium sp. CBMA 234]|uniref:CoA transferase n=1 Tax=Mycolicibacterium sp. CBMA 234 TaxID=1918495 RepID=UPI0012DD3832|nr:CoA transferase [Mycolicibacterium sp. CBMA 234]MUL64587.1 hypothetical protein [Mycolicibacterium sp. CBMA 234]